MGWLSCIFQEKPSTRTVCQILILVTIALTIIECLTPKYVLKNVVDSQEMFASVLTKHILGTVFTPAEKPNATKTGRMRLLRLEPPCSRSRMLEENKMP